MKESGKSDIETVFRSCLRPKVTELFLSVGSSFYGFDVAISVFDRIWVRTLTGELLTCAAGDGQS